MIMMRQHLKQSDIDWLQSMIEHTHTGSIWACPCTETLFKFDHENKILTVVSGDINEPTNQLTKQGMEVLGWKVI